jgi:hypothetical protein
MKTKLIWEASDIKGGLKVNTSCYTTNKRPWLVMKTNFYDGKGDVFNLVNMKTGNMFPENWVSAAKMADKFTYLEMRIC